MTDNIAVMHNGRIVEKGTRRDIFDEPQHIYTKRLLSAIPSIDVTRRAENRKNRLKVEQDFEDKKENSAEKSGAQISGEQEELWKVTPDQVIHLRKKDSPLSEFIPTPDITLIGEPVTMGSLAAAIEQKCGKKVQLLCPLEITEGLLRRGDEAIRGE